MKLWSYLFIVIIITVLLYFLAIVSATSKVLTSSFQHTLNSLVCLNVQIKQYPNNFYGHHYQSVSG